MNKIATLSLLTAAALSLTPKPAEASDKNAAIVGGMILGGIIGAVIADSNNHTVSCEPAPVYCPPPAPVVYAPAPVIVAPCPPVGYWNDVRVQVYVPGCWSVRYDHGRQVRYFAPGHYEWRTNRVWVAGNGRHDDHRDRQVSSGYGRGNDRNRGHDDRRRNH